MPFVRPSPFLARAKAAGLFFGKTLSWLDTSLGGALVKPSAFPFAPEKKEEISGKVKMAVRKDQVDEFLSERTPETIHRDAQTYQQDSGAMKLANSSQGFRDHADSLIRASEILRSQGKSLYHIKGVVNTSTKPSPFIDRVKKPLPEKEKLDEVVSSQQPSQGSSVNLTVNLGHENEKDVPWQEERETVPSEKKRKEKQEKQDSQTKRRGLLMAGVMDKLFDPALMEEYRNTMMGGTVGEKGIKSRTPDESDPNVDETGRIINLPDAHYASRRMGRKESREGKPRGTYTDQNYDQGYRETSNMNRGDYLQSDTRLEQMASRNNRTDGAKYRDGAWRLPDGTIQNLEDVDND